MTPKESKSALSPGRMVWAATAVLTIAAFALVRVPTHLGVKVEEANRQAGSQQSDPDMRGSEYLWRVWWRARDDMVDVSPSWLLGAMLLVGLVVFLVCIFGAYRIALSIPSSASPRDV